MPSEWQALPKTDLQLDLLAAAPPRFIRDQAARYRMDISGIFAADASYIHADYPQSRKVLAAIASVLRSAEDYHRLALAALEASAEAGVVYAELYLSPLACGDGGLTAWSEHLSALCDASDEAARQFGLVTQGVAVAAREQGPELARRQALLAAETAGDWLCGFAVEGEEPRMALEDLAWPADCAREAGLQLALGVGPDQDVAALRSHMRLLRPDRLHGGLRLADDPALVEALAERAMTLVSCPAADLAYARVADLRQHPIGAWDHRGLAVAVASQGGVLCGISLARQFDALARAFDWDEGQFRRLGRQALDAAFCADDRKDKIKKLLEN